MIYYKEINEDFLAYGIKDIKFDELFHSENLHEWINVPVTDMFTDAGLQFFSDRNIKLRKTTRVFRLKANHVSDIHVDSDYYDAAFNFIVEGTGVMQWVTVINGVESNGSYIQSSNMTGSYKRFDVYEDYIIDESWSGKCALVKINTPHRVIGGASDRYCISVRPIEDHFFNDLVSLF
jgi:hypothetical protein